MKKFTHTRHSPFLLWRAPLTFAFVVAFAVTACSGDRSSGPYQTAAITILSDTVTIARGSAGGIVFNVQRFNAHTPDINFAFDPTPQGITASFLPPKVTTSTTATNGAIAVAANVSAGYYSLTARAWGDWLDNRTTVFPITVRVVEPGLVVTPSNLSPSSEQGVAVSMPVIVERTGMYNGDVMLSTFDLPEGYAATLSPQFLSRGATTSVLSVTPSLATAPGVHRIGVRASGSGVSNANAYFNHHVLPTSTPSIHVRADSLTVTLAQSSTVTVKIAIERHGGAQGPVTLSFGELPLFVTSSFSPAVVEGDSA